MSTLLFSIMLAASAASVSMPPPTADDLARIVEKTRQLYDATTSAEVRFVQSGTGGTTTGTLIYSGDRKFYLELPKQTIVNNGVKAWTYYPERNQVVISRAAAGGNLTPNDILRSFPGSYKTELIGREEIDGHGVWAVRCVPGSAGTIGDVTEAILYIDRSSYRFRRVTVKSPTIGSQTFSITSARYNINVPASRFNFTVPEGARVVDLSR